MIKKIVIKVIKVTNNLKSLHLKIIYIKIIIKYFKDKTKKKIR